MDGKLFEETLIQSNLQTHQELKLKKLLKII